MCLWIDLVPPHYNPQFQIRSIQVESRSLRLYGATGKAGSVILKELVDRLTSSSLQPALQKRCERSRTSPQSRTTSAIRQRPPASSRPGTPSSRPMGRHQSRHRPYGSPRQSNRGGLRTPLIVVGGAGSLFVAPGVTLRASGRLPKGMDPHPSCANSRRSRRIVSSERSNSWLTDLATTCPSARSLSTFGENSPLATGIPATPATQMRPELHLRPMPAARLANADVTVSERFGHSRELP
jgi:hypothetical protein